jgi:hypothetical protein
MSVTQACECPACGLLFRSVSGFDAHRVGPYAAPGRRCLTAGELLGIGYVLIRGKWQRAPEATPRERSRGR